jgi:hypothetical protein
LSLPVLLVIVVCRGDSSSGKLHNTCVIAPLGPKTPQNQSSSTQIVYETRMYMYLCLFGAFWVLTKYPHPGNTRYHHGSSPPRACAARHFRATTKLLAVARQHKHQADIQSTANTVMMNKDARGYVYMSIVLLMLHIHHRYWWPHLLLE